MNNPPFWVNEVYSLGYWLKDYGYYPKTWPLFNYMDHGMPFVDNVQPHESANSAPLIFKFSPRLIKEFRKVSNKPVYNVLNPTIHCRRKKKIERDIAARGTLFFPGHSTTLLDDHTSWDSFIEAFVNIPEQFRPIDICLHPTDVKKGLDKIFEVKGYKVFNAGSEYAPAFAENFYNILRNYKYSMSNLLGSYLFYSVEMGIPFSLFGPEPLYINHGDTNIEKGAYVSYKEHQTFQKATALFNGFNTTINTQQAEFVRYELGIDSGISRIKTSYLLYRAYFEYLARHPHDLKSRMWAFPGKIKKRLSGKRL